MESIKYFLYLLDIEPFWPAILLISLAMKAFFPYRLKGKSETKKDKNGDIVTKYYEEKDLF